MFKCIKSSFGVIDVLQLCFPEKLSQNMWTNDHEIVILKGHTVKKKMVPCFWKCLKNYTNHFLLLNVFDHSSFKNVSIKANFVVKRIILINYWVNPTNMNAMLLIKASLLCLNTHFPSNQGYYSHLPSSLHALGHE